MIKECNNNNNVIGNTKRTSVRVAERGAVVAVGGVERAVRKCASLSWWRHGVFRRWCVFPGTRAWNELEAGPGVGVVLEA